MRKKSSFRGRTSLDACKNILINSDLICEAVPVPSVSGFKFSHQKMADGSWSFFEEDEVCRKTADGSFMYGFVVKNSTYQSSDEEEDDEDRLEKGKVRVSWHPSGKESVVSENQVWNVDTL